MDSRLKFLHHLRLIDDAVTQKDRTGAVIVKFVGRGRPGGGEERLPVDLGARGTVNK